MPPTSRVERRRLEVRGRVQGVGFRPFVARLAAEIGLAGFVGNDSRGAFVELEGGVTQLERFVERLHRELPPLARIHELSSLALEARGEQAFRIVASATGAQQDVAITPDSATCDDCRRELADAKDRRYRYPFINCTNCGPRYSIIQAVPYDRPATTMAPFAMCARCQAEYDAPTNRRYHAQPNACADCGPRVWLSDGRGQTLVAATKEDPAAPIDAAAARLRAGEIVAIKGLGGFHLACRADDEAVVERLRQRKGREAKPLALMVASPSAAEALVELDDRARAALCSPAAPIVVAPRRDDAKIANAVAPQRDELGVVLAYTPLHLLLATAVRDQQRAPIPLVLTSGNDSGEPLSADNDDALARLGRIADAFLLHDREIARPIDDSVLRALGEGEAPLILRRARGYVPDPLPLSLPARRPILALGGDLKGAVCVASAQQVVLGEHLGDLEHPAAFRNFVEASERLTTLLRAPCQLVVHDLHPDYHSTAHARSLRGVQRTSVQHHHAHAAACLVENGLAGPALALCCDGTGYGDDGAIWGGELLLCDAARYERVGQLRYLPLVGGDAAARETWRPAAGWLFEACAEGGEGWRDALQGARQVVDPAALTLAAQRLEAYREGRTRAVPRCSSLGRLFDAAAFLCGFCDQNRYEGEAAMLLEAAAQRALRQHGETTALAANELDDGSLLGEQEERLQLDTRPLARDLVARLRAGEVRDSLAAAFHETIAQLFARAAHRIAVAHGVVDVLLTGGCFANRILLRRLSALLAEAGLTVHRHRLVPPGDGGLALGQAAIAAARDR